MQKAKHFNFYLRTMLPEAMTFVQVQKMLQEKLKELPITFSVGNLSGTLRLGNEDGSITEYVANPPFVRNCNETD